MKRSGNWEENLRIIASRRHQEYRGGRMVTVRIDRVRLSYSPHQRLQIQGERRVFNGKLVIPAITSQTAKLRTVFDQAFSHPDVEIPKPRRTSIVGPVIRMGATT